MNRPRLLVQLVAVLGACWASSDTAVAKPSEVRRFFRSPAVAGSTMAAGSSITRFNGRATRVSKGWYDGANANNDAFINGRPIVRRGLRARLFGNRILPKIFKVKAGWTSTVHLRKGQTRWFERDEIGLPTLHLYPLAKWDGYYRVKMEVDGRGRAHPVAVEEAIPLERGGFDVLHYVLNKPPEQEQSSKLPAPKRSDSSPGWVHPDR